LAVFLKSYVLSQGRPAGRRE